MVHGHLIHFVITIAMHGSDSPGISIVVIESCPGGDDLHINTE
jgi:hypothetical protein